MLEIPILLKEIVSGEKLTQAILDAAKRRTLKASLQHETISKAYLLIPARLEEVYKETRVILEKPSSNAPGSSKSWFANVGFKVPLRDTEVRELYLQREDISPGSASYDFEILKYLDCIHDGLR